MTSTQAISEYIQSKGISIVAISESTGISYGKLYPSLKANPTRELRGDELLAVCKFLDGKDPRFFAQWHKKNNNAS